jgi:hypothetical protein
MKIFLFPILLFLFLTSCSSAIKVKPVPYEYRSKSLKYFVQQTYDNDRYGIAMIITSILKNKGYNVSYGSYKQKPIDANIVIVYDDQWQWDITDYLLHMRIDLRDPETNVLLATGSSYQTSVVRKDERIIIQTILSGMFID